MVERPIGYIAGTWVQGRPQERLVAAHVWGFAGRRRKLRKFVQSVTSSNGWDDYFVGQGRGPTQARNNVRKWTMFFRADSKYSRLYRQSTSWSPYFCTKMPDRKPHLLHAHSILHTGFWFR